jgi:hypothetical protein
MELGLSLPFRGLISLPFILCRGGGRESRKKDREKGKIIKTKPRTHLQPRAVLFHQEFCSLAHTLLPLPSPKRLEKSIGFLLQNSKNFWQKLLHPAPTPSIFLNHFKV